MSTKPEADPEQLVAAMKKAAGVLRDAGIPFALMGGLAVWARGGPESDHDVDFIIKPEDAERAQEALVAAGMRADDPPEEWLLKAWDDGALVDLIFNPHGGPVNDEWLERADEIEVMAMKMPVASLEDVLVSKLLALTEQEPEFASELEVARAVREQVDWEQVRERTKESPFARAFFTLIEGLGIVEPPSSDAIDAR